MGPITITVQESVPVTVPAELLGQLKVKPGDQLEWRVDGGELVIRRVRSVDSLRGCLASTVAFPGLEAEKDAIRTRLGKPPPTGGQPGEFQAVAFDGNSLVKSVQSMASHVRGGRQVVLRWQTLTPDGAKQASGASEVGLRLQAVSPNTSPPTEQKKR